MHTKGLDIPLSTQRLENSRNFVNKLWNIGKYIKHAQTQLQTQLQTQEQAQAQTQTHTQTQGYENKKSYSYKYDYTSDITYDQLMSLPLAERYIISRLNDTCAAATLAIEKHAYSDAGMYV